jgi:hypothetical protein
VADDSGIEITEDNIKWEVESLVEPIGGKCEVETWPRLLWRLTYATGVKVNRHWPEWF